MTQRVLDLLQGDTPAKTWLRQHLNYDQDWHCLIWPFSRAQTGYGQMTAEYLAVHRLVCEFKNGPPPTNAHQAAHSCGRGPDGCGFRDRPVAAAYKLTPEDVDQIRSMKGRERTVDTAARFQVSERNVRMIQNGETWRADKRPKRLFSEQEIALIRSTPWQIKSARVFAKEFGVGRSVIDRIREGKSYQYFPMPETAGPATEHPPHQPAPQTQEGKW
jgi:hypothetical protein